MAPGRTWRYKGITPKDLSDDCSLPETKVPPLARASGLQRRPPGRRLRPLTQTVSVRLSPPPNRLQPPRYAPMSAPVSSGRGPPPGLGPSSTARVFGRLSGKRCCRNLINSSRTWQHRFHALPESAVLMSARNVIVCSVASVTCRPHALPSQLSDLPLMKVALSSVGTNPQLHDVDEWGVAGQPAQSRHVVRGTRVGGVSAGNGHPTADRSCRGWRPRRNE